MCLDDSQGFVQGLDEKLVRVIEGQGSFEGVHEKLVGLIQGQGSVQGLDEKLDRVIEGQGSIRQDSLAVVCQSDDSRCSGVDSQEEVCRHGHPVPWQRVDLQLDRVI